MSTKLNKATNKTQWLGAERKNMFKFTKDLERNELHRFQPKEYQHSSKPLWM